jgi:hypothetical protein
MSRTPAAFTQADIARVIRAAKQCGADTVEVKAKDGSTLAVIRLRGSEMVFDTGDNIVL